MVNIFLRKTLAAAATLAALMSFSDITPALVPAGVTQQGRLIDSAGEPVSGELTFVFTIYDDPAASDPANELWQETLDITLDDGYFSARLGDDAGNLFPADLFDGSTRYLGVKVGSDDEMAPRQRIASVPYAHLANNVNGDITPNSVTVNSIEVVDVDGMIPAAQLKGFSSLLSLVSANGTSGATSSATASCGAGRFATGGGCGVTAANGSVVVKINEPTVSGGKPTGWTCACSQTEASVNCTITADAVCVTNN
jgi:hypothetical protein